MRSAPVLGRTSFPMGTTRVTRTMPAGKSPSRVSLCAAIRSSAFAWHCGHVYQVVSVSNQWPHITHSIRRQMPTLAAFQNPKGQDEQAPQRDYDDFHGYDPFVYNSA